MLLIKLINLLFENPVYFLISFIILTVPLLISITIHEWAHGFAAYKFGDNTPKEQGRLSLNPIRHLDPVGTLMLFIVGIGWAKPVEINPSNIDKRYKLMLVALAGPLSNFIFAVLFSFIVFFILKITELDTVSLGAGMLALILIFTELVKLIIKINLALGLFNLIPIPPLDGSNIIRNLLPEALGEAYFKIAPYGFPILLVIIFTGAVKYIFIAAEFIQEYIFKIISVVFF